MSFIELVNKRESIRHFIDRPVPREIIDRCLEAARLAPSACNSQPWTFVVVDEPDLKQKLAGSTYSALVPMNRFTHEAPVLLAVVAEKATTAAALGGFLKDKPYYLLDIGIAAEHFCLQASEEQLGTCLIGWFDEKRVRRLLGVPSGKRIPLLIAVGYSATDEPRIKKRKTLHQIRKYNQYRPEGTDESD